MDDIYMLPDTAIPRKIGERLKKARLQQNITQHNLAQEAGVSLSSIRKIEKGEIGAFETLMRVLRTLGLLEVLQPLVNEPQPRPSEYYEMVHSAAKIRQRASATANKTEREEETSW